MVSDLRKAVCQSQNSGVFSREKGLRCTSSQVHSVPGMALNPSTTGRLPSACEGFHKELLLVVMEGT